MNWRPRVFASAPPELVVYDEPLACPYLVGHQARLPMRLPTRWLTAAEFDSRLRSGDRRQGVLLYRTACAACRACEPIRIDVETFEPGKTQRRIFRRGKERITYEIGPPEYSDERLALYNKHKRGRGLAATEEAMDEPGYRAFLVETCCDTFELRYRVGLMSRELRITELARSGLWRRAAFGRWRLEVSEPRWNRARLKQGLIGGATLVDPHGGPVATLRTRTLRRGVWLELEPGTEFPRAWALGLALAYAIAGS